MNPPRLLRESELLDLRRGSHVCWVVEDDAGYVSIARSLIRQGSAAHEKVLAFAPAGSDVLEAVRAYADVAADPLVDFLGGRFDSATMFSVFREQDRLARDEGFNGLCIVADMDWLLGAKPTLEQLIQFELLADRLVRELRATTVCAYRARSFNADTIVGVACVHPFPCSSERPQFQMIDGDTTTWTLRGEVDIAVARQFAATLDAVSQTEPCVVDVADLEFIDVRGLATLARAAAKAPMRFRGVTESFRRLWDLGSFDDVVQLEEIPA